MYSKRLFLLFCGVQFLAQAADDSLVFAPTSSKSRGATAIAAVRRGSPAEYEPLLAALHNPTRKLSYFNKRRNKSVDITPTKLCIDAIFKRPEEEKFPLIDAFDTHIVQLHQEVLLQPCHREKLPYEYAYQKLNYGNRAQPFVLPLFMALASKAAREQRYTDPAMITVLALQLLNKDDACYKQALANVRAYPAIIGNLNIQLSELSVRDILDVMLEREPIFGRVAEVCIQDVAKTDTQLAYHHMMRLLSEQRFKQSPEAQQVKNNLLFWTVENPHLPEEFITWLLRSNADPYALKPQRGLMTPLQTALASALRTQSTDNNAFTNLQALLDVRAIASKNCTLESGESLANDVRDALREQIGASFCANGLEPFQEHLSLWRSIAADLKADVINARRVIYDILVKHHGEKSDEQEITIAKAVAAEQPFKQFVLAMEIERFCMIAAYNMICSVSAYDLHTFLSMGDERQIYSADEIPFVKKYTRMLCGKLNPVAQTRINAYAERYKVSSGI